MADAGRILIIPRGDYDANSTYEKLDLVKYKGTAWLAKRNSIGIEPSEGEYWQNMFDLTIANNLTTEKEGYALDASQGKVLDDKVHLLSDGLQTVEEGLQTVEDRIAGIDDKLVIKRQQLFEPTYLNDNVAECIGDVVHVSCFIESLANGFVAFTLQDNLRPSSIRQISCAGIAKYSEWYLPLIAIVDTSGDVKIFFMVNEPHTDIRLEFTYFIR